jgi:amidase
VVPISHTQDTVGPHARTVADAAATLGVIQSRTFDGRDPATGGVPLGWRGTGKTRPTNIPSDYTQFLDPHGLRGARLGLTRAGIEGFDSLNPTPKQIIVAFNQAAEKLRAAGATVIDLDKQGFTFPSADGEFLVLCFEFRLRSSLIANTRTLRCRSLIRTSSFFVPRWPKARPLRSHSSVG